MSAVLLLVVGAILFGMPLAEIMRRYGELTEDAVIRFIMEMTIPQRMGLSLTISLGLAMVQFGLFMLVRPHA